jgi:hypothetical protein
MSFEETKTRGTSYRLLVSGILVPEVSEWKELLNIVRNDDDMSITGYKRDSFLLVPCSLYSDM